MIFYAAYSRFVPRLYNQSQKIYYYKIWKLSKHRLKAGHFLTGSTGLLQKFQRFLISRSKSKEKLTGEKSTSVSQEKPLPLFLKSVLPARAVHLKQHSAKKADIRFSCLQTISSWAEKNQFRTPHASLAACSVLSNSAVINRNMLNSLQNIQAYPSLTV